jgi:hypothetical protein
MRLSFPCASSPGRLPCRCCRTAQLPVFVLALLVLIRRCLTGTNGTAKALHYLQHQALSGHDADERAHRQWVFERAWVPSAPMYSPLPNPEQVPC